MKDDKLFEVVKKQIDAADVYALLEGGAPKDEFDIESALIASRLEKGMSVYSIAQIIAQVMNAQFEDNFKADEFIPYAKQIEKLLNNNEG